MNTDKWSIWYYIRSYKFNSIFIKTFFLIILPTALPLMLISLSIYNYNTANIREEIKAANINSLSNVRNMVDMITEESDSLASKLASDDDIKLLMSYPSIVSSEFYTMQKFQNLHKLLSVITSTNKTINSAYVYFENSDFVLATDGYSMDFEHFPDRGWMENYNSKKKDNTIWVAPRSYNRLFQVGTQHFITTFRPITNYNYNGVVIVNIDVQKLRNIINGVNDSKQQDIIILNRDGLILYHTDQTAVGKSIKELKKFNDLPLNSLGSSFIEDGDNVNHIVTVLNSGYNQWKFISTTPLSQYSQRTDQFLRYMFLSLFASLLIAIIIAFLISIRVFQPIKSMVSLLDAPQEWEGIVKIDDEKNFNEFKYLARTFLKSLDKTRQMEEAMAERMALLRKAQSVALQAQINPHFLYNTLETINWKAMGLTGGENEVSEMLASLSQLLRLSLETENSLVTIETEIEHAKLYLDIQRKRYKDKFNVVWDIDDKILSCKIVKLSIQPLIENAIYHGIKPKKEYGTIAITGMRDHDRIAITIKDDGVGLEEQEITALNDGMKDNYIKEDQHIGMKNVNQRIKLIFGEEYGLSIESEYKKYTSITLTIPIVE